MEKRCGLVSVAGNAAGLVSNLQASAKKIAHRNISSLNFLPSRYMVGFLPSVAFARPAARRGFSILGKLTWPH